MSTGGRIGSRPRSADKGKQWDSSLFDFMFGPFTPAAGSNDSAVLRVNRHAPQEEIRHAYLKMAKKYHPDRKPALKVRLSSQGDLADLRDLADPFG